MFCFGFQAALGITVLNQTACAARLHTLRAILAFQAALLCY